MQGITSLELTHNKKFVVGVHPRAKQTKNDYLTAQDTSQESVTTSHSDYRAAKLTVFPGTCRPLEPL